MSSSQENNFKEHGQKPNLYGSSEFAEVQVDLLKKPFKANAYMCERKTIKNLRFNLVFFPHIYFFISW